MADKIKPSECMFEARPEVIPNMNMLNGLFLPLTNNKQ
jgi:hypothetical protein